MADQSLRRRKNWRLHLNHILRELWEQHIMWTRSFIISATRNLDDREFVTRRLLLNPQDFAAVFNQFYGPWTAQKLSCLLTKHLLIATDIVSVGLSGIPIPTIQDLQRQFYQNAGQIAAFLSRLNPHWNEKIWRGMLYNHNGLVELAAGLVASAQYDLEVEMFAEIEDQALRMADYMTEGIIRQFNL